MNNDDDRRDDNRPAPAGRTQAGGLEGGLRELSRLRLALRRMRDQAGDRWRRHGEPLVAATRGLVRDAADAPRDELERERYVNVGEAHLKRLIGDWVARAPKLLGGSIDLEDGVVHGAVTLRRWRPVRAEARFRLVVGEQDDVRIEIGICRTRPTTLDSEHVLMRLLVRCYAAWARWRGRPDPFDEFLLRLAGSRRDGDVIFLPVPRAVLTERVGKSRVLRRIAAYATISSLAVKPGELVVGYHLGLLADRMADMYVLRRLVRDNPSV
jgi:hypothetical protein